MATIPRTHFRACQMQVSSCKHCNLCVCACVSLFICGTIHESSCLRVQVLYSIQSALLTMTCSTMEWDRRSLGEQI